MSLVAVVLAALLVFIFYAPLYDWLMQPFLPFMGGRNGQSLFVHSIFEGFLVKIKFSFKLGLVLALPICAFHALRFVLPGLEKRGGRILVAAMACGLVLAIFGFYVAYFFILPYSLPFLLSKPFIPGSVGVLLNFNQNVFYIINILLYAMLLFQLPIILEVLLYTKVLSRKAMLKNSHFVIVGILFLTALATPPDVVSQVGLAIPLIGLYFLTIFIAKLFRLGRVA